MAEDSGWVVDTWSARRNFVFESGLAKSEYLAWLRPVLGRDWHCQLKSSSAVVLTRLASEEQQTLELRIDEVDAGRIRIHATFIAMPT